MYELENADLQRLYLSTHFFTHRIHPYSLGVFRLIKWSIRSGDAIISKGDEEFFAFRVVHDVKTFLRCVSEFR